MQAAVAIIAHALRMLIFETGTTLRVIRPALVLVIGSSLIAVFVAGDTLIALQTDAEAVLRDPPMTIPLIAFLGLVGLIGYALMAILWHRHVLLSGMDRGQVMRPDLRIMLGYVGKAIAVGFVQFIAAIPIVLGMGLIIAAGGGSPAMAALAGLIGSLAFVWVALRLSLILPAAALGARMTLMDSWETTSTVSGTILGVAALLTGLNWCAYTIASILTPDTAVIGLLIQTIVYVLEGLVFISVLTTFYGHLVEGRALE